MATNVFAGYKKAKKVILVATDAAAHAMFQGKTLGEIGNEFKVDPSSVAFTEKEWEGNTIVNLVFDAKGNTYSFPLSRGLSALYEDGELTPEILLDCEARVNTRKSDNADYMTLGKAGGIIDLGERKAVFTEEAVSENA